MRPIELARDVVPIAQFKAHVSELVQRVKKKRRPVVVTVNGLPAAVLISPADFDQQQYAAYVRSKIERGIADVEAGRVIPHEQVFRQLRTRLSNKKRKK